MSASNPFESSYTGPGEAPDGCENVLLPDTTNPNCPADYNAYEGELCELWMVLAEQDEDGNWVASAEPDNYLYKGDLNAIVGVKRLAIIGDKPLPETRTVALAKRWTRIKTLGHTLNIDVTDVSEENYEFIRTLQYRPITAVWVASVDGWHMGGNGGIIVQVDTAGIIWPRGEGSLMTGTLVLKFDHKFDPPAGIAFAGTSPLTAKQPEEVKAAKVAKLEAGRSKRKNSGAGDVVTVTGADAPKPLTPANLLGGEADNGETEKESPSTDKPAGAKKGVGNPL